MVKVIFHLVWAMILFEKALVSCRTGTPRWDTSLIDLLSVTVGVDDVRIDLVFKFGPLATFVDNFVRPGKRVQSSESDG